MAEMVELIGDLKRDWEAFKATHENQSKTIAEQAVELGRIDDAMSANSERLADLRADSMGKLQELEQLVAGYARGVPAEGDSDYTRHAAQLSAQSRVPGKVYTGDEARDYGRDFAEFLRTGRPSAAMTTESDPDGGYLVSPDLSGRMVGLIYEQSDVRQHASVASITSDALEGENDLNQAGAGWVGERAARPETDTPGTGRWRIPVHEMYANPRDTQRNLDDAARDVAGWLQQKVGERMGRLESEAFVVGSGVEQPRGFTTYPVQAGEVTAATWGNVQYIPSGHATNVISSPAPLIDAVGATKTQHLGNAIWLCSRQTLASLRKITVTDQGYVFVPNFSEQSPLGEILGHPIYTLPDMPATGTANNLFLAFGDFRAAYQIVDRAGIRVLRDPFTVKPYVQFYTTRRVGGDLINFDAIKLIRQSAS